ncbi:MAG TPA: c-type cytochrome domain-containing protein [Woeseiaceae bacterium]|jgi:hypothetical protein|nr:c-type cytochrome domain-containing protein [Woeseiaceae bacterium]
MIKAIRHLLYTAPALLLTACGQGEISFSNDIQPIFETHCVRCHSGTAEGAMASKFNMADYNGVMTGTQHGQVVVPGSRLSSALYLVVAGKTAPEIRMPPHNEESFAEGRGEMLSANMIETIGLWIDQGAKNN